MATLKEILGEELYEQAEAKINAHNAGEKDTKKHVQFVDLSEGTYVHKNKFDGTVGNLNQTITDLREQIEKRDVDMAELNTKLTTAQDDAGKQLKDAQDALTALQTRYDTEKQLWDEKTAKQAYEFAVKTEAGKLNFSSAAAQRDFIRGAIDKGLKMDGDQILGFTDYVAKYKEADPKAFVEDVPETPPGEPVPPIVLPKNPPSGGDNSVFGFHFNGVRPMPKE